VPYRTLDDLPESVRDVLPKQAQRIYRAAFNHAWVEYADPADRAGETSREGTAHRVAWAAVKRQYEKSGSCWRRRP
jgi:cation transport regulator